MYFASFEYSRTLKYFSNFFLLKKNCLKYIFSTTKNLSNTQNKQWIPLTKQFQRQYAYGSADEYSVRPKRNSDLSAVVRRANGAAGLAQH